ncbi:PREDICTED: 28S ribosomal protein S9, mitochondrial [Ceratosolen solmsi marchali]|uniref:Small ribosomal subunit protein uS9m n=1 Tax=Ceratosolen solmsi marchali TaxID=326594 RepID=A0AAJ6YI46_9HYME|nr:PREDICTED: 28S ribosomal protein S9, mitochondrial [Ceratosolen solmsi marchali]
MVVLVFSQLIAFKHVKPGGCTYNLLMRINNNLNNGCLYSTEVSKKIDANDLDANENTKMSKAMKAYLERAKAYDDFIKTEENNYNLGKLHLSNMMGVKSTNFTQIDVDKAIRYLFPSGLYDKKARPIMKHPKDIFPVKKAAQFDSTGRPYHSMFYTTKPHYYKALYDVVECMHLLDATEDKLIKNDNHILVPIDLSNSQWVNQENLEGLLVEKISTEQEYFISSIEKLCQHPLANDVKDFIMIYRKLKQSVMQNSTIPELMYDSNNRPYILVTDCMRKNARGEVLVIGQGSGKITVNGLPMVNYFKNLQEREQIIFPLHFTDMMDRVDVEARITGGGPSGQSGAIRWGIAWALRSFVDLNMIQKMKVAGLITRDWRIRERKKPGQEGARRKFTWKKR